MECRDFGRRLLSFQDDLRAMQRGVRQGDIGRPMSTFRTVQRTGYEVHRVA